MARSPIGETTADDRHPQEDVVHGHLNTAGDGAAHSMPHTGAMRDRQGVCERARCTTHTPLPSHRRRGYEDQVSDDGIDASDFSELYAHT